MTGVIETALTAGSFAAFPLMLFGGFISGLNPCCVALYPAAALTCCGARGRAAKQAFSTALAFTVGLALATAAVGTVAAVAGRVTATSPWFRYAIATVPLVMGIHLLGWLRLPIPSLSATTNRQRLGAAFGSGLLFSLIIGPCSTPVFASALSYAAYTQNAAYGAVLLFLYGLGAGIPVLLAGATIGRIAQKLEGAGCGLWINRATGVSLVVLGFYLLWIA